VEVLTTTLLPANISSIPSKIPERTIILAYLLVFLREFLDIKQAEAKNNFIIRRIKKLIFNQFFSFKALSWPYLNKF
jgi:hypothetical protein